MRLSSRRPVPLRPPAGGAEPVIAPAAPQPDAVSPAAEPLRRPDLLQEHLRRRDRIEALRRTGRHTAHELNNLLMVVQGALELAATKLGTDDESARKMIHHARRGADRIAVFAATLQLLRGPDPQDLPILEVPDVVAARAEEVAAELAPHCELRLERLHGHGPAGLTPVALEDLLRALVRNAGEAMPDGGRLTVRTQRVDVDPTTVRPDLPEGAYVVLEVEDTGPGMDAAARARLFEPYFTTKKGADRGLGLAAVYGIVRQAGGAVWVDSEPGEGTTVRVYLPCVAAADPASPLARPDEEKAAKTVLVVDDESSVLDYVRGVLLDAGYEVLVADRGDDALELAREHRGDIRLLLTDVVIPGLNGRQLADRLAELRPDTAVLFMSGFAEDVLMSVSNGELTPFLPKPFSAEVLRQAVADALARHA